jgi:hypothetical protein
MLGDVNGDGIIDDNDLALLDTYTNYNLTKAPPLTTTLAYYGSTTVYTNGYSTMLESFANATLVSFQVIDGYYLDGYGDGYGVVLASGTDGVLVASLTDPRLATFTSAAVNFSTITGIGGMKLVIQNVSPTNNYGGFEIVSLDDITDTITIRKIILSGDTFAEMLRADIDGDFHISSNDGYLLQSYLDRYIDPIYTVPYPGPTSDAYLKIGTKFDVIRFTLEQFTDRSDDYTTLGAGRSSGLHPIPDIFTIDGYYPSHNFYTYPSILKFEKQLTWEEYLIVTNSRPKYVPSIFTTQSGFNIFPCSIDGVNCNVYAAQPDFDGGRVDAFVPDNLIIGNGGELQRPDGNFYKVDFELGTIILEIPDGMYGDEHTINILEDFIASTTDDGGLTGLTKLGFPAMRFADCSFATTSALSNDQVRFSVSVQSFSPNTNGLSIDGYYGPIVDGKMGVSIDYATGLLRLNFTNLYEDTILSTLSTKIQVHVFLKKGGFNNQPLFVDSVKMQNMLNLISIFSGVTEGGPSGLVDLESGVTGVLPIIHGGTSMSTVGLSGTVLTSTGTGLTYSYVYDLPYVVEFSLGLPQAHMLPRLDGYGLLDPSFMYKNPVYVYGCAGAFTNGTVSPIVVGAFPFRFDKYILEGLDTIKLEVILETSIVSNAANIQLFNVTTASYVDLIGASPLLTTTATSATFIVSDDIKDALSIGAANYVYEIHLNLTTPSGVDTCTCKMARLVMSYNNPATYGTPLAHSYNFIPWRPTPTPS